jgi:hypothetical protein
LTITESEILDAIRTALASSVSGDDAMTTTELGTALGTNVARTRNILRGMIAAGRMAPTRVYRPSLDGYPRPVAAYRLVKAA